ncbi:MAG: betaine--homocysteine S-methyltransferase [Geminicoccaceae bacterium]
MTRLQDLLENERVLLADGGMGTALFRRGLETGDCPELWNIDHPDRVADVHREFVEAGSDIILTNSFGGNAMRLKLHAAQDRVAELNAAAARIARSVADMAGRTVLVAGSMGPTGEILEPVGSLSIGDATAAFADQAIALKQGGADLLWCETLSSAEEMEAAIAGASRAGLPVVCTMSFDTNGRTMMGLTPDAALAHTRTLASPPVAFGANCGIGPAQLLGSILGMGRLAHAGDILVAKGNCGIPEYRDGHIHYSGTPDIMATYAVMARDAGAAIIGGCCGTGGVHLAAMRKALDTMPKGPLPGIDAIEAQLGAITTPTDAAESHKRDRDGRRRRRTG